MRRPAPRALPLVVALAAGGCGGAEPSGPDFRLVTPPPYVGAEPIATPPARPEPRMDARDARVPARRAAAVRAGDPRRPRRFTELWQAPEGRAAAGPDGRSGAPIAGPETFG